MKNRKISKKRGGKLWINNTALAKAISIFGLILMILGLFIFFVHAENGANNPIINFTSPTYPNNTMVANVSIPINISITEVINSLTFNWNGTNYTFYNNSLLSFMNFENLSELGENATKIVDLSSYSNNGTTVASPIWTNKGKYGGAYTFLGTSSQCINLKNPSIFNPGTNSFSYSIWFNNTLAGTSDFVLKTDGTAATTTSGYRLFTAVTPNWLSATVANGSNVYRLNVGSNTCTGTSRWCHAVIVVDRPNNLMSLYLNGYFNTSVAIMAAGPVSNTFNLTLGGGLASRYFTGQLDDFMMWNRTLSTDEIKQLYMSSVTKVSASQWYWNINQTQNATTNLGNGTYTYQAFVTNMEGSSNTTENRYIIINTSYSVTAPDTEYPLFADYWDNNGTLLDTGIGSFNVTLNNTNGTVILNINGQAIKAINLTSNVYNASYNFTYGGTYSYTWTAYGNGTSHNLNMSTTRYYTVNATASQIQFIAPTLPNNTITTNTSILINISITETNLTNLTYNWNGTNFAIYDNTLRIYFNFDNITSLGETYAQNTIVYDISTYHNNGNLTNSSSRLRSWAPTYISLGKYGGAFNFTKSLTRDSAGNDNGSSILVPHSNSLNPYDSDFAMIYWFNCPPGSSDDDISRKGSTATASANGSNIIYKTEIGGYGTSDLLSLNFNSRNGASGAATSLILEWATPICDGAWHHTIAQRRGNFAELWVDGIVRMGPTAFTGEISNSANLTIGCKDTQDDDHYEGMLDEYRIYINRSFNTSEIFQLYASNLQKYNLTQWYFNINQSKNITATLANGTYNYQAFVTNLGRTSNQTDLRIVIINTSGTDNTNPSINITSPINGSTLEFDTLIYVFLNVTANDTNGISSYWYNVDGGVNVTFTNQTNMFIGQETGTTKTHIIRAYVNDTYNNVNSSSVAITTILTSQRGGGGGGGTTTTTTTTGAETTPTPISIPEIPKQNFFQTFFIGGINKVGESLFPENAKVGIIFLIIFIVIIILLIIYKNVNFDRIINKIKIGNNKKEDKKHE